MGNAKDRGEGVDEIKNRSEKCERPRVGGRQDKEPEWEMRRTEVGGGDQRLFEKIKVFLTNQKHEPNIVEVTHLCIMHEAHTSIVKQE